MPVVPVPELRRKLALLRAYSPRTSWDLLATPFGVSPKTLKYWGHGSATREPDQVQAEALPVLLTLFAEVLPGKPHDDEVRRLVFGPVARLEEAIRSGAASSFARLIAQEGQSGTAALITRQDESRLVEIDEGAVPGVSRLALGAWFRIEFPVSAGCRYAATLQGAQQAWAAVPSIVSQHPPGRVLLPGRGGEQDPLFMRERRDIGLHRFVCLQTGEPFPTVIEDYLREEAGFDKHGLDELAGFYSGLPPSRRACHVLTVAIEPDSVP